jgi:hypothetical protein
LFLDIAFEAAIDIPNIGNRARPGFKRQVVPHEAVKQTCLVASIEVLLHRIPVVVVNFLLFLWWQPHQTESTACRIILKIEKVLCSAIIFTLPGKKSLYQSEPVIKTVVIDVTESPIERPKKNRNNFIAARRKSIPLSLKLYHVAIALNDGQALSQLHRISSIAIA